MNETLPRALALIEPAARPQVVHQTGASNRDAVQQAYAAAGVDGVEVVAFIDDMAARLADCDVVVCRAGAVTVSELCAAGVASVLVPLSSSTTSHQRDNALYMAQHGAALHLPQGELAPERLADLAARPDARGAAGDGREGARPVAPARRGAGGRRDRTAGVEMKRSNVQRAERRAAPKPARISSGDRPMYPSDEGSS